MMRTVHRHFIVPARAPADVYATIADFARYPQHSEAVRSVSISAGDDDRSLSSWEVNFRNGIMRWVEEDTFDPATGRIDFRQVEGDMAAFDGAWTCEAHGANVLVTFTARFDLGIPSLASALEPIAVRTLVANTIAIVTGLFGADVRVHSTDEDASASADVYPLPGG
jgi:ribosome-associated toxin RatA of RatAB toxin-antitoxin module